MPKPGAKSKGLVRLTGASLSSAPDEPWVKMIQASVNSIVDAQELGTSKIKLLSGTDVEIREITVQVPDPWIEVTSFDNGWGTLGDGTWYRKDHYGLVELLLSVEGGAGSAFTLPSQFSPARDIRITGWDTAGGTDTSIIIGADGTVTPVLGPGEAKCQALFLAKNSSPIPMSCWPIVVSTSLKSVAGVMVCDVRDFDQDAERPSMSGNVIWSFTSTNGKNAVKILNIPWLPYNRRCRVKILIIGG